MASLDLNGLWIGYYLLGDKQHPIAAQLRQDGARLSGSMRDAQPDSEYSLFESAVLAGLPPGADEQIAVQLRNMVPEAGNAPIRYVSHLPAESMLEGRCDGMVVSFQKTYKGTSFSGYRVGERLIGIHKEAHKVHYEGQLSENGLEIEGRWWIDADPERGIARTTGLFTLARPKKGE